MQRARRGVRAGAAAAAATLAAARLSPQLAARHRYECCSSCATPTLPANSGVCYNRCPRRRARTSARSQLSCALSKAACAATRLLRPPQTPLKTWNCHSAK
ncbi:unnamed protein product [Parnassius apollo]|uniref:(apollo) hypothetical protein n=1 Tax=Parnassius apollo TaxID=110799 RepID=A0A8S3YBC6_PARAO|nr:unnamed protein product [Parnassius apollo]